jgi:hypothetical protein
MVTYRGCFSAHALVLFYVVRLQKRHNMSPEHQLSAIAAAVVSTLFYLFLNPDIVPFCMLLPYLLTFNKLSQDLTPLD